MFKLWELQCNKLQAHVRCERSHVNQRFQSEILYPVVSLSCTFFARKALLQNRFSRWKQRDARGRTTPSVGAKFAEEGRNAEALSCNGALRGLLWWVKLVLGNKPKARFRRLMLTGPALVRVYRKNKLTSHLCGLLAEPPGVVGLCPKCCSLFKHKYVFNSPQGVQ